MFQAEKFQFKQNARIRILLVCLAGLLQLPSPAAQNLTLAWNPSAGPNVVGYKIYYGTACHKYDSMVSVGNVTTATVAGLVAGSKYFFAVTACDVSNQESFLSDEAAVTIPTNPPVTLSNLPPTGTVAVGQTVTLSLTNAGAGALNCQWKFNGGNIAAATNAVLTLTNVTAAQAGQYFVTVSDGTGSTNSTTASLMIYSTAAATLKQPAYADGQFTFSVSGVPGNQYVVQASTNNVNWFSVQTNTAPFTFVDANAGQSRQCFYRTCNYTSSTGGLTVSLAIDPATTQPVLTQSTFAAGQFSFNVSGVTNQQYVVQASTNLVDWVPVQTNTAPFTFVDADAGQFSQRFYRTFLLSP
jgi:hypothetical protein